MFLSELKQFLSEKKEDILNLINDTDCHTLIQNDKETELAVPKILFAESKGTIDPATTIPISYHYEMGKLVSKEDINKFRFFSSLLKSKCKDNELVLAELNNMEDNLDNDLEYYCSYHLIDKILSRE